MAYCLQCTYTYKWQEQKSLHGTELTEVIASKYEINKIKPIHVVARGALYRATCDVFLELKKHCTFHLYRSYWYRTKWFE